MRDPTQTLSHSHTSASPSPSPSPSPYPVSIRAYKKKDYDYLSRFPRMGHSVLRTVHSDGDFSQDRSDCDSDTSMTASSVRYTTSNSSASSTSSAQSYAKHVIVAMDAEAHLHQQKQQQQQQEQQPQHPFLSTQISGDCAESAIEMKDNKIDDRRSAGVKEDDKSNITRDSQGPIDEAFAQLNSSGRSQLKHKPKPSNTSTVLPKFGSWDTRNPSSGDAYTLIFRRLREEKKSGGLPVCTSPIRSKEGPEECLSQESKSKEPLQANPRVQKGSARQKQKGKPHQDATYNQRNATRWSLCCKASVLDD